MEIITPPSSTEGDSAFSGGQPGSASGKREVPSIVIQQPAGFIRRGIAYMIDSTILTLLCLFFSFSGLMGIRLAGDWDSFYYSGSGAIFFVGFFFLYTGYFTFFHAYGGQTPAKMILRIMVVTGRGTPPSHLHSLVRTFCFFASHLFLGVGFLITIFGRRKRALHDLLTGTQVILSP